MTISNPVRRIADILDATAMTRDGITLGELASTVGLPVSTTHRTVNILLDVGYLSVDPATKSFRIGERLQRVVLLSVGTRNLRNIVWPTLIRLAEHFSETAYFVQAHKNGPQLVDHFLPTSGPRTLVHPGFDFPIHATAAGKAIYAFLPEEAVEHELAKKLERFTDTTVTNKQQIRAELGNVRKRGYAFSNSELDPGVFAIAAPVLLDRKTVIGSVAVTGVKDRLMNNFEVEAVAEEVMKAADEISEMLLNLDLETDEPGRVGA